REEAEQRAHARGLLVYASSENCGRRARRHHRRLMVAREPAPPWAGREFVFPAHAREVGGNSDLWMTRLAPKSSSSRGRRNRCAAGVGRAVGGVEQEGGRP